MRPLGLVALAFTLVAGGCTSSSIPPESPQILARWSGSQSGRDTAATELIHDLSRWTALWRELGREPPRPLDPAREIAVVAFVGQRRTAGYAVEFVQVRAERNTVFVEYHEITPPPTAMVAQVITSPWAVAVISRTDATVNARRVSSPARVP